MTKVGSAAWIKEKSKKPKSAKTIQVAFWRRSAGNKEISYKGHYLNMKISQTIYLFEDEFNELVKFYEKKAEKVEASYQVNHMIGRIDVYVSVKA